MLVPNIQIWSAVQIGMHIDISGESQVTLASVTGSKHIWTQLSTFFF